MLNPKDPVGHDDCCYKRRRVHFLSFTYFISLIDQEQYVSLSGVHKGREPLYFIGLIDVSA